MKHVLGLALALLFLTPASPVLAQSPLAEPIALESDGLVISPPSFELAGNPGTVLTNVIRLENKSDATVRIGVDRRNFTAVGEEGAIGLTEEETSFSLASWLTVQPSEATLAPRSSRNFTIRLEVPQTVEPGGHFGSVIFKTLDVQSPAGSGAGLAQEIGALFLLKVAGDVEEEAKILSFDSLRSFYEKGPVEFESRVENLGNVHLKPAGVVTITNLWGKQVASLTVNPKNVLPGAVRKLESTWETKWRFGRYTATYIMTYGSTGVQRASVTTFTILPYRHLLGLTLILFLLLFFFYKSRRRLRAAWKVLFSGRD